MRNARIVNLEEVLDDDGDVEGGEIFALAWPYRPGDDDISDDDVIEKKSRMPSQDSALLRCVFLLLIK